MLKATPPFVVPLPRYVTTNRIGALRNNPIIPNNCFSEFTRIVKYVVYNAYNARSGLSLEKINRRHLDPQIEPR